MRQRLQSKAIKSKAGRAVISGLLTLNYRLRRLTKGTVQTNQNQGKEVMSDIQGLFEQMVARFDSAAATGLDAVFQYRLEEGDLYYAVISNGECILGAGEHDDPSVVLLMDTPTFKEVLEGETNGMQAFMAGRIRAEGDIMLATRLEALFPVS